MGSIITKFCSTDQESEEDIQLTPVRDIAEHTVFDYNNWLFTHAVFEGGGINGIGYLGTCIALYKAGIANQLTHFSASSIGAVFALLLALRVQPSDMQDFIMTKQFEDLVDDKFGIFRDTNNLINHYGWCQGEVISNWVKEILSKFAGKEQLSFIELYNLYGTELNITGSNVNEQRAIMYNRYTTPNEYIYTAVIASMTIPVIFPPQKKTYDDSGNVDLIVDGGLINNYDLDRFDYHDPNPHVIGFKLMNLSHEKRDDQIYHNRLDINNFTDYLSGIITIQSIEIERLRMKNIDMYWERTLTVPSLGLPITEFTIDDETKVKIIVQSYNLAIVQLNGWIKNKKFVKIDSLI